MADLWPRLLEVIRRLEVLSSRMTALENRQVQVEQNAQQQGSDGRANAG